MNNPLGTRVRQLRYERKAQGLPWSQVWLASVAGCSRQTIIFIESGYWRDTKGEYKPYFPGPNILDGIARAFDVSVDWLAQP